MGSQPIPVGDELRRAREAAGLEISDVAAHLRIRSNFLAALEEGRPDALPGVTYAIGYVRTYAGFLGLDPETSVRRFKEEAAGLNSRTELVFPSPAPEGRVPGMAVMLVALLLAGGAYGGWYWVSERDGGLHDLVPLVPERLAQLIEGEAPSLPTSASKPTSGAIGSATPRSTAGTYADANPTGVALPATGSTDTKLSASPSAPQPSGVPQASTLASAPVITKPAEPTPAPSAALRDSAPTPLAVPTPTPAPVAAMEPPASVAATDATTQATSEPVPTGAASDDTPDVTALPEPTSAARQVAGTTPLEAPTPPQARAFVPVEPDVPAAPRIAGLIGASEAAVPTDRTTAGPIDRIMIRATGDSWVQVRDSEGTALFTRVLREGDIYRVPSKAGLKLATGNAGALDILVDGVSAPRLGGFGDVVRNIVLDPARLAAGTAASATR
jgi:cytoskeleton protein RodZ